MTGRTSWLAVVVGAAAAACAGAAADPALDGLAFPRHSWSGGGPTAVGEGTLVREDACFVLRAPDATVSYLIVWPPDARLVVDDAGVGVALDGMTFHHEDHIRLGGGFYSDAGFVAGELRDSILPPSCVTPEIFMATQPVAGG